MSNGGDWIDKRALETLTRTGRSARRVPSGCHLGRRRSGRLGRHRTPVRFRPRSRNCRARRQDLGRPRGRPHPLRTRVGPPRQSRSHCGPEPDHVAGAQTRPWTIISTWPSSRVSRPWPADRLETAPGWFGRAAVRAPLPLRFGLWSFATHAVLPGRRTWLASRVRPLIRLVDAAAARHEVCHFSLPLLALTGGGRSGLTAIEKLLRHVARRREQGTLDVLTLSATAQRLTGTRQAIPARSILRPAA